MDIIRRANAVEIPVSGKLDMETARKLEQGFENLLGKISDDVIGINMANLKFLDSSGLSILMKITSKANEVSKKIYFISLSPTILSVMKVARLDNILDFMSDEEFNSKYPLL